MEHEMFYFSTLIFLFYCPHNLIAISLVASKNDDNLRE